VLNYCFEKGEGTTNSTLTTAPFNRLTEREAFNAAAQKKEEQKTQIGSGERVGKPESLSKKKKRKEKRSGN